MALIITGCSYNKNSSDVKDINKPITQYKNIKESLISSGLKLTIEGITTNSNKICKEYLENDCKEYWNRQYDRYIDIKIKYENTGNTTIALNDNVNFQITDMEGIIYPLKLLEHNLLLANGEIKPGIAGDVIYTYDVPNLNNYLLKFTAKNGKIVIYKFNKSDIK